MHSHMPQQDSYASCARSHACTTSASHYKAVLPQRRTLHSQDTAVYRVAHLNIRRDNKFVWGSRYREERRKQYPTAENMEKREQERAERQARGESEPATSGRVLRLQEVQALDLIDDF